MPLNGQASGAGPSTNDLGIHARLSLSSATSKAKDIEEGGYVGVKTPDTTGQKMGEYEGGALRPGGMPVLTSKENIGLLFHT
ncbi:uncharacterized protein KRP23_306 [Phytophthora ramorum]|uniref:uncharacterized protein n=1 Tax=Phytophthora ramorum TaxID=164328 RepID=UPI00309BB306|nr:hypothetical protein KRP23_306 [Phytophthora ramorum]